MPRTVIGCDLSRAVLDLHTLPDAASAQIANDPDAVAAWVTSLEPDVLVAFEAVAGTLGRLYPDASIAERHAIWLHSAFVRAGVTATEFAARGYAPELIRIVEAASAATDGAGSRTDQIEAIATEAGPATLRVMIAVLTASAAAPLPGDRDGEAEAAMLARLHKALADRSAILDDSDPEPSDMIPVVLSVEPVEHAILEEAAKIADRSLEDFILEEASGLAHRIVVTGSLSYVDLARDPRARNMRLIEAIRTMSKT